MQHALRRPRRAAGLTLLVALVTAPAASADPASYTRCPDVPGASLVEAARVSCDDVAAVATAVAAAPAGDVASALTGGGWTPYRALPATGGGFDLVALRGTGALRVRRPGEAPDLDGFAAGRELIFARPKIVGGAPIPRDASVCTSAFLVRLGSGSLGGLSAAHCAGLRRDGTTQRRYAALRRPPVAGIVLGRVQRVVARAAPFDALLLPVPQGAGRTATGVVDRGVSRPPWIVAGAARTTGGRTACYSGRTSGIDRCGTLLGSRARTVERFLGILGAGVVRCTTVAAAPGDSGAPVYTAPRADGTVRALGIATVITGPRDQMCFVPVQPVLDRLGATLVTDA